MTTIDRSSLSFHNALPYGASFSPVPICTPVIIQSSCTQPHTENDAIFPQTLPSTKSPDFQLKASQFTHQPRTSTQVLSSPSNNLSLPPQIQAFPETSTRLEHQSKQRMFSPGFVTDCPHPKSKEKEEPTDPPRGRTSPTDKSSPSHHDHGKQADSRSVSRGRTHGRSHHGDRHGNAKPTPEDFVYPCPTGGYSPKGRPPTLDEAAYLSDAPHLDYKTPTRGRKRAAGGVRSPQPSHIRREMEAGIEMAGARGRTSEKPKEAKDVTGKAEEH